MKHKKTSHEELAEVLAADVDSSLGILASVCEVGHGIIEKSTPTWEC